MPREQVSARLEAVIGLLRDGDPATFGQGETHLRAALEQLQSQPSSLASDDLQAMSRQCRRVARLVASAQELYAGLTSIMSTQATGYGPAARAGVETGRRFVIEA